MNVDKVIIFVAVIILLLLVGFRERLVDEAHLVVDLEEVEADSMDDQLSAIYFLPLSQEERQTAILRCVEDLSSLQDRISESLFVKYFVDFRDAIITLQQELFNQQLLSNGASDAIAFWTLNMHRVAAHPEFPRDKLIDLGKLIDEIFYEDEIQALFALDMEDYRFVIVVTPIEGFDDTDENRLKRFADRVSAEILEGEPLIVRIDKTVSSNEYSVAI